MSMIKNLSIGIGEHRKNFICFYSNFRLFKTQLKVTIKMEKIKF